MNLQALIKQHDLQKLFLEANIGIEKEGIRTDENNQIAMTDHPHSLGDRLFHPYIHTDFSEAQPEIVTPVQPSVKKAFNWLEGIQDVLNRALPEDEFIWPSSMPNILPEEDEIPIIRYNDPDAIQYREYLAEHYGKKKQTISGIHLNFSFSQAFLKAVFEAQTDTTDYVKFVNDLYVKLAGNFLKYEWMLLYLFGASPYAKEDFFDSKSGRDLPKPEGYVRSLRNSSFGYHNHDDVVVRYDSVSDYVADIEEYVETGHLSEEREFYGNARLRGKGDALREMLHSGVQYIEFRSIDINPLERLGLSFEQGLFYQMFYMLMVWLHSEATTDEILEGQQRNLTTSDEHPLSESAYKDHGIKIMDLMLQMLDEIDASNDYVEIVKAEREKFIDPSLTLAAKVAKEIDEMGYLESNRKRGLAYKHFSTDRPYVLNGFMGMEHSTQLLIADALQHGIEVEVLDEQDQFLKLSHKGHHEYVRNGNMTSHDTTISHFLMENKTVTKKVLHKAGYKVPLGDEYQTLEEALGDYTKYKNHGIVVKPKSTNYGIGISVFKNAPSKESFEEALKIAFKEDESVLVEEYVAGTEYRFFVLNGEVAAVLLRIPANVVGDGESTISELIDQKNDDPLRGENHRAPMAYIQKGELETLMLKEQGYTFDSVPEKDVQVFLRENSNISTGGDSIDFTDEMHETYNDIAKGIAKAIDVKVTGIDLIIPDYQLASTKENPGYSCIEANFNPAMNMHAYVTEGRGRRLSQGVLAMLFPELITDFSY